MKILHHGESICSRSHIQTSDEEEHTSNKVWNESNDVPNDSDNGDENLRDDQDQVQENLKSWWKKVGKWPPVPDKLHIMGMWNIEVNIKRATK